MNPIFVWIMIFQFTYTLDEICIPVSISYNYWTKRKKKSQLGYSLQRVLEAQTLEINWRFSSSTQRERFSSHPCYSSLWWLTCVQSTHESTFLHFIPANYFSDARHKSIILCFVSTRMFQYAWNFHYFLNILYIYPAPSHQMWFASLVIFFLVWITMLLPKFEGISLLHWLFSSHSWPAPWKSQPSAQPVSSQNIMDWCHPEGILNPPVSLFHTLTHIST